MKHFTRKSIIESSLAQSNYLRMREEENRRANYEYYGEPLLYKQDKPKKFRAGSLWITLKSNI
jgi:hypothetical protein